MRKSTLFVSALLIAGLLLAPRQGSAQFTPTSFMIGPHIGFGGWGGTTFGAYGEKAITKAGEVGPGIIGIAGRFDYSSWGDGLYSWNVISVGAFGVYHFKVESTTWDPFAGIGLAYEHYGWSGPDVFGWSPTYSSGIFIAGNVGARYFFSPNLAIRGQLGFGMTLFAVGLDFGL